MFFIIMLYGFMYFSENRGGGSTYARLSLFIPPSIGEQLDWFHNLALMEDFVGEERGGEGG